MAFPPVVDHHNPNPNPNHLHLESLPLIDLGLLSQSDLYSLSLTSSSSSQSHPTRRFDDNVLIPKIDRSVFNESAGSRKQTYSRLRLAPRNSQFPVPNPKSQKTIPHSQPRDPETLQIIALLKQLFPSEKALKENDDVLVPVPVRLAQYDAMPGPSAENFSAGLSVDVGTKRKRGRPRKYPNATISYPSVNADVSMEMRGGDNSTPGIVVQSSEGKRKRGRPRKDENRVVSVAKREKKVKVKEAKVKEGNVKVEEAEIVMVNGRGVVVDLAAVENADGLFGEELRRRTEGMDTEVQLLAFLGGLEGQWSSARKKRKIVPADELGDVLPVQWKILLALKRNGGLVRLFCKRYIRVHARKDISFNFGSPNREIYGKFVSCKEVSSYLISYFGVGNKSIPGHTDGSIQLSNKLVSGDGMQQDTNTFEDEIKANELPSRSLMPITFVSPGHEKQENLFHTENSQEFQAGEEMDMPKKVDPINTGILQTSLKIHESGQIDREISSDAVAKCELSAGFPCGKVNNDITNCFGTNNREFNSLSCEDQALKNNKLGKDLGFSEQGSAVNFTNDKLVDKPTGPGLSFGETITLDCFHDGINDGYKASVSTVDVLKVDTGTALNGMQKERRSENFDDNQLTSTEENTKFDDVDDCGNGRSISGISGSCIGPENVCTNFLQQSTSEACSLLPSTIIQSLQKRGSERGLCSTTDEKTCDVRDVYNSESLCTSYRPKFDNIDQSGNEDKAISLSSEHGMLNVDAMEINEHVISTGSSSSVPGLDGQSCINLSNAKNPSYIEEELWQEKSFLSNVSVPFVKQGRGSSATGMIYPSGYAQSVNSTYSSSMEESKKEEAKSSWNNEVILSFGSGCAGPISNSMTNTVHERSSGGPSIVQSENSQTFFTGNKVTGIFSSSVLEDKLIRGSVDGLIHRNGNEQTSGFENNLNRVYSSIMWEQPNTESAEKSRNNEPMTGFLNHSQPSGDVMAEFMWRTDEHNVQQSGLADTSSELMQSSGYYPNFDMLSDKGANGALSVNEKFDNMSGLEGLGPGQFDYNIPTVQATSHTKESKVLSCDGELEQGFSSSDWLEKESLPSMPNITSRHEINTCVWCRNEFPHGVYERTQPGSVGLMCATCQANFSGDFL
ncbi:uncharacterized protein LOC126602067 isoform X1 [Malus sylvestris]|uniref:uncharacterized protein LOC126602067 isoform X1 n=1 Tax=Malus sylvestris TaxID=3752 RepID=UPI0021AC1885|nr:uncharacterized protein LOC126602067 isoform X1 [Malus sylvestris]